MVREKLAGVFGVPARQMSERPEFRPIQAEELARAFNEQGVEYLFIGKSGAILLGYPIELRSASNIAARKSRGQV